MWAVMRRYISAMRSLLVLVACLVPAFGQAEDAVAVVDLTFVKATDKTAVTICNDNDGVLDDCHPWATFNIYKARVTRLIRGEVVRKSFLLLYGRHSLGRANIRGLAVVLKKLDATSSGEPLYQVVASGQERSLLCFADLRDAADTYLLSRDGQDPRKCYEQE